MSGGQGSLLDVFFGTELRFLAIGVAAYGIATALRLRSEESAGRAEIVLATPVSRWQWLGSHALIAVVGSLWLLVVVGVGRRGVRRCGQQHRGRRPAPGRRSRPHPRCWSAWR